MHMCTCMFWEPCVHLESASKRRAISSLWIAKAMLSTRGEELFFITEFESQAGSVLSETAAAYCAYSAECADGWSRGPWFGELFSFYSWHKVFGRMENASSVAALASEVGNGRLGVLRWRKCKIRQELINPHVTKVWFGTWQALALESKFSLPFSPDDTFFLHCCLLAFVV